MKEEFFYETTNKGIFFYRRSKPHPATGEFGVLKHEGWTAYTGDTNDSDSIKKEIDKYFTDSVGGKFPTTPNYIAHRLTIDDKI